jgi:glycosyltransferase involved in cell wall biosynthesis
MHAKTRLGLDTRNTALRHGTGVASYANTLGQIAPWIGFEPQWLTAGPTKGKLQRFGRASLTHQTLAEDFSSPDIFRVAQEHFNLYRRPLTLLAHNPPPLMHWTYPLPLSLRGTKNIVTIHDLIPLQKPALTEINGARLRRLLNILVKYADGIVTVSETTRTDIIEQLGVPPERVKNLYQGVDVTAHADFPGEDMNVLCPAGSFVTLGTVEPRKNIGRLIAAHAQSGVAQPLVIIGPDGPGAGAALSGAGNNVIRVAYASRKDILRTLSAARALLFPSLAEGFGLPIAEAFALGVPVMTSRGGATEEIAGGAALLVDPHDIGGMAAAIALLARDNEVSGKLKAAGDIRAQLFTPQAYASRVQFYYETILKQQPYDPT